MITAQVDQSLHDMPCIKKTPGCVGSSVPYIWKTYGWWSHQKRTRVCWNFCSINLKKLWVVVASEKHQGVLELLFHQFGKVMGGGRIKRKDPDLLELLFHQFGKLMGGERIKKKTRVCWNFCSINLENSKTCVLGLGLQ